MPELPEVEVVRRSLALRLKGSDLKKVEVHDQRLRFPVDVALFGPSLVGRVISGIRRRSKYLLIDLEKPDGPPLVLLWHLGMTGRFSFPRAADRRAPHDHITLRLAKGGTPITLRYNDVRRFGFLDVFPRRDEHEHPRLIHLGVEPLEKEALGEHLFGLSRGSRAPIKSFIMNAKNVVGVGNIYANEALFAAGIRPTRAAGRVSRERYRQLGDDIRRLLSQAVDRGGTTLRDFRDADGTRGTNASHLRVYGRERQPCLTCGTELKKLVLAGRSTVYCPKCQS